MNSGIEKQRKQKQILYGVFQSLKEKNIEAYREKDKAIQSQQQAKKDMTKMFEQEIEKVTSSYQDQMTMKTQYEAKKGELEVLAEEYKVLETQTKAQIEKKDKRIHTLQQQINDQIENGLKGLMDTFNNEKAKYDKYTADRDQLNTQYKDLKEKFQKYLAEIEGSDEKCKLVQQLCINKTQNAKFLCSNPKILKIC